MISGSFFRIISITFFALTASLTASCQRLSNNSEKQLIECGNLAAGSSHPIYRIDHKDAGGSEVWEVVSSTFEWQRAEVNDKGCFKGSSSEAGYFVIRSGDKSSGTVISKEEFDGIRLISLPTLKLSEQIPEICPEKTIHVAQTSLSLPVQMDAKDERDYFFIIVPNDLARRAQPLLLQSQNSARLALSLTGLSTGANDIKFSVYDLLRSDRKLAEMSCQIIVDKEAPGIIVKDSKNRELDGKIRTFAPGEKLFVSTSEPVTVQYCISEAGKTSEVACSSLRGDSTLDLPGSGSWSLQFQIKDRSGNTEVRRFGIEIFDQNAVDLIRTRARLSMDATAALDLEAARQQLEGARERASVEGETRLAMLTSMLRTQEINRSALECQRSDQAVQLGNIIVLLDAKGTVCAYRSNGDFLYKKSSNLSWPLEDYKIFQDRYIVYSDGDDPRYKDRLHVFDSVEGTDRDIVIKELNGFIDDFDVNPGDGTIHILTKAEVTGGPDEYLSVTFDGAVKLRKVLKDYRYTHISFLPLPGAPTLVLGYTLYNSSRRTTVPEFCDMTLTVCESRRNSGLDFKDVFVNPKGTLLLTHVQGKTLAWDLNESTELLTENAREFPGNFVQFLEKNGSFVTSLANSYRVQNLDDDPDAVIDSFASLEVTANFIYDERQSQALLINQSGFERWIRNAFPFGQRAANDKTLIDDALVLRGALSKDGTELTLFTQKYVARYQLSYAQPGTYSLFAGSKAGIMSSNSGRGLIYSNAGGQKKIFDSDRVRMSPQKKYALLQKPTDEGLAFSIVNSEGTVVATAQGDSVETSLVDSAADDSRLLYRLNHKDFFLFDSSAEEKIQYLSFEGFDFSDSLLLSQLPGQVLITQKGDIRRVSTTNMQGELIASQASKVQTGKKFPFVSYLQNNRDLVVKNLVTGEERRWENATLRSVEEACHSLFIRQEKAKVFSILDLRNFKSLDFYKGGAKCLEQSGQLVVEDSRSDTTSSLLDGDYNVLTTLPATSAFVRANKQGIFVQRDIEGKEFFSYAFDGTLLGRISSDKPRSPARYPLEHYTILSYDKTWEGDYPKQTRYELYDRDLNLLGTSTEHEDKSPTVHWELVGPVLWNHAAGEIFELNDPLTNEPLLEYIPVPHWDGIRFYPVDNRKLFDVLKRWIESRLSDGIGTSPGRAIYRPK